MNLTNYYWYFQSAVPARICDEIVKYGKSISDQMAVTGGYGDGKKLNQKQIKDLKTKRNSDNFLILPFDGSLGCCLVYGLSQLSQCQS